MNFLLVAINAKYIHSNPAIYSLRQFAGEQLWPSISLAEYTINQRMEEILSDIYRRKPDVIGFSCYIWNWELVQQIIGELHKLEPLLPIWLGGPEVSYEYERVFRDNPAVTGIMVGEGEETFQELVRECRELFKADAETKRAAETDGEISLKEAFGCEQIGPERRKEFYAGCEGLRVRGTVTRSGNWGYREPLSMDQIPFYISALSEQEEKQNENRILYYETSRGCPFRCSYCLSSIDKKVRLRSFELVKRELQFFLDKKVPQVKFIDRTFNCNHEHAKQIWRYIKEKDNGITNFHFEISADLLDEEELEIMSDMRPGLIQLEIGVQTTNEEALRAIHRTAKLEPLKQAVAKVHSFGNIHQHLDLIAGLPYEDLKSFRRSFDDVYEMKPQQLQLGFLKVLKGSEMFERAEEYGIVYQSKAPYEVLYTKWLSYEDVLELKKVEEMVELFYNSNQFTHTLPVLQKLFETPYELFLALAEFYEKNGYFIHSPARAYRYQILLSFVSERKPELHELFAELLTFDLYLRENAKSRPDFSRELYPYKTRMTDFYKRQTENSDVLSEYVEKGYDSKQMFRMTHMEVFYYPVWNQEVLERKALTELMKKGEESFVLFDYGKRSPLTHEASFCCVSI